MTSSNETSVTETWRKSRTFTWIAVITALLTVSAFGIVLYKVNLLESEYGEIRASKERILREIKSGQEQHTLLLSDIDSGKQELAGLKAEVAQAQTLQSQLSDLNEQVGQARQAFKEISAQTADAEQIIALSAGATTALSKAKDDQNDLIRRIEQLNRDAADAEDQVRSFQSSRDQLQDEVRDLEAKKRELDATRSELASKTNEMASVESRLAETVQELAQKESDADSAVRRAEQAKEDLEGLIPRVEDARRELNDSRDETSSERANLEGLRRDVEILSERVRDLKDEEERLISLQARVDQTLAQLEDAEAKLNTAQASRTQAEVELDTLRDEQDRIRALSGDLAKLQNQEAETLQKIEELNVEIQGKTAARDTLLSNLSGVKAQFEEVTTLLSQRQSDRMAEEAKLQTQSEKLADINNQLSRLQPQLAPLRSQVDEANAELTKIQGLASAKTQELILLRSQVTNKAQELNGLLRTISNLAASTAEPPASSGANSVEAENDTAQPDSTDQ